MFYALVHYPAIETKQINQLRKRYDPQVNLIEPHITVVFPVPEVVGERRLFLHLEQVLRGWQPFVIQLRGLHQSADNSLFLLVQEGSSEIIRLHNELYTGVLAEFHRDDLPFVPHITLGSFSEDEHYRHALHEAEQLGFEYMSLFDRLHLVKVNGERSQITWSKEFLL